MYDDIFKKRGKWIRVYVGKETIEDPIEKNTSVQHKTHFPILAVIEDLTSAQAAYKMIGIQSSKAKDILIDAKYRNILELSTKIFYDGDFYQGWRDNSKLQIREVPGDGSGDYLRIYMYSRAV